MMKSSDAAQLALCNLVGHLEGSFFERTFVFAVHLTDCKW